MNWKRLGRIFDPYTVGNKESFFKMKYGILPTPVYHEDKNIIRVYFGMALTGNECNIHYIDISADDPTIVLTKGFPENVLFAGPSGTFDCDGINPSSVVVYNDHTKLYYVGYQLHKSSSYSLWSGLAQQFTPGTLFKKYEGVPILDRSGKNPLSSGAPFVIYDKEHDNKYRMWLWVAQGYQDDNHQRFSANIGYAISSNGYDWTLVKTNCIFPDKSKGEYSVGRPWVVKTDNGYEMFYSVRHEELGYRFGYAISSDGINWQRMDNLINFEPSMEKDEWDSEMICYPAVIDVKGKRYMFYNGNNNGLSGFGVAIQTL